jgi:formamidopyrimidine-DNA glycosylase
VPELPEVETTRRSLEAPLLGASIRSVRMGKPLRWPLGVNPSRLSGCTVISVQRRGKYLWLALRAGAQGPEPLRPADGAARESTGGGLLIHLGMSGSLAWIDDTGVASAPGAHDHFDMQTDRGLLRLTDPRRFGAVVWSRALDAAPASTLLAKLGAEPFDQALTAQAFHAAVRARRSAIKTILLSGQPIVGAGNIYACEALFEAGVHPHTRGDRITRVQAQRLLEAVRGVLARAIDAGGTTLRDYRNASGEDGRFQNEAKVYGREGQPCVTCFTPVRRVTTAQRSTFFCARCQPRR